MHHARSKIKITEVAKKYWYFLIKALFQKFCFWLNLDHKSRLFDRKPNGNFFSFQSLFMSNDGEKFIGKYPFGFLWRNVVPEGNVRSWSNNRSKKDLFPFGQEVYVFSASFDRFELKLKFSG